MSHVNLVLVFGMLIKFCSKCKRNPEQGTLRGPCSLISTVLSYFCYLLKASLFCLQSLVMVLTQQSHSKCQSTKFFLQSHPHGIGEVSR